MKLKWKEYFQPYILERGRKYVREHRVEKIQRTNNGYEAIVQGEEKYHVEIQMVGPGIRGMECSCSYVQNRGKYCKHMAAVLYELELLEQIREKERIRHMPELTDMTNEMTREDMQRFLMRTVQNSPEIEQDLRLFLTGQVSKKELERQRREIDAIFAEYTDNTGFVEWRQTGALCEKLQLFLTDKIERIIEYENHTAAFDLITYLFDRMCNAQIGENGDAIFILADECLACIEKILLQERNGGLVGEIYDWMQKRLSDGILDPIKEKWYDFIMGHFQEIFFLERKMQLLDEKIKREENAEEIWKKRKWCCDIARRLQLMEQLGYSEEECRQYQIRFWDVPEIRQMEIRKKMQQRQYDEAENLILESQKMDEKWVECQEKYCRQLADLYQIQGRAEEYQRQLISYFLLYHQDNIELWRKIRSTVQTLHPEAWTEIKAELLEEITLPYFRYQILAEEKMFPALIAELGKEKCLESLDQYAKILRRKFSGDLVRMYADCLVDMAGKATGREKYKNMAAHLQKLKTYPGGAETVDIIVKDWKRRYRRKTALMEELEQLIDNADSE